MGVGLLMVLSFLNPDVFTREARPEYDGQQNFFTVTLVNEPDPAIVNEEYSIDLRVTNTKDSGSMFVQCSILDKKKHDFLNDYLQSAVTFLPEHDNCVLDEPFTQTAKVQLDNSESRIIRFTVIAPNNVQGDNYIYCSAFERCYVPGQSSMESDAVLKKIEIKTEEGDSGLSDTDAKNEKLFDFNAPDISDESIKLWVKDHQLFLIGLGIALFLLGMMFVYKEPKPPKYF